MRFTMLHHQKKVAKQGGFSLVELMVSIAIVMLVTGAALVRYGSFNSAVLLKSQAYETALDVRQAQVYGVSVSRQTANFRNPYGMFFSTSNPNTYVLFQGSGVNDYTYTAGEEIGQTYVIDPRFEIVAICNEDTCESGTGKTASIAFARPNFDAKLRTSFDATPTSIGIKLASVRGGAVTQIVRVYASGQITVEAIEE